MSNWIEWDGGECPVSDGAVVQVELRGGDRMTGAFADEFWRKDNSPGDIVAYRVVSEAPATAPSSALNVQEGGSHYKTLAIQPVEYIHKNGVGYFEGNVIKYVTRWKAKGGMADLKKARHYIDLLIELEGGAR
jgi:hypothetical protein